MDNVKPQQIVLLASGAVLFLFSFFAFVTFSGFGSSISRNAWSGDLGLSPLSIFPALLGLAVAGLVAAVAFGNVKLPDRVLTLTWPQLFFTAGFASFFILFGLFLTIETPGGVSFGFGFWLMLLASIGILVGAVMEITQGDSSGPAASGPAQPF
jgi:hypothetical protein